MSEAVVYEKQNPKFYLITHLAQPLTGWYE